MPCRPELPAWPAEPMSAGPAPVPTQRGPPQWVLQRHFHNVEPPGDAVHRLDDAALVDEHTRRSRARPTHRIHSPLTAPAARRTTMGRVRLGRPGRAGSAEEEPCD